MYLCQFNIHNNRLSYSLIGIQIDIAPIFSIHHQKHTPEICMPKFRKRIKKKKMLPILGMMGNSNIFKKLTDFPKWITVVFMYQ